MVKESPSCNLYLPCESAYAEPSWKATCVGVNPVTTSPTQSTSFASGRYRPVVNPHYNQTKGEITLPTGSWRLLDAATDPVRAAITGSCPEYGQVPYLPLVAAPASSLSKITLAMEFAYPLSPTLCSAVITPDGQLLYRLTRLPRQPPGKRFMLGVTSLGEASRYQLDTASLQTQVAKGALAKFTSADGRTFVAPTDASLQAAAKLLVPDTATQTWQIPSDAIRTRPEGAVAYPATMVVYTEVPTRGLSSTDASRYAQFLKFAAADGQSPGTATGQLPPGYLPMTPANGLGTLAAYTRTAADAVAAQSGKVPPIVPGATPSTSPTPSTSVLGGNATKSSSPTSTASTSPDGSSPLGGGGTAIGPILRSGSATSRSGGSAKAPVSAPEAATKGALAAIGKTAAIISH